MKKNNSKKTNSKGHEKEKKAKPMETKDKIFMRAQLGNYYYDSPGYYNKRDLMYAGEQIKT